MINKKNMRWHVAFIIAATLVIFNPEMSRIANLISPGSGLPLAVLIPFLVSIAIFIFEKIPYKRAILKSPYFLFLCCWVFEIILLVTLPKYELWKNFVLNVFG